LNWRIFYSWRYGEQKGAEKMIEWKLTIAEIMLIAGTRVALGVGLGLLLSGRLNKDQRKAAGWALALVGGLTTIPLALGVIGKKSAAEIGRAPREFSYPVKPPLA
jgi:hypothetical protein